jgi:hypothetical protein
LLGVISQRKLLAPAVAEREMPAVFQSTGAEPV